VPTLYLTEEYSFVRRDSEDKLLVEIPARKGKDGWKRISVQSTGTGTVRFNHSRQPFWKRDNALAIYFMKLSEKFWPQNLHLCWDGL
jgi:hypothetical protein